MTPLRIFIGADERQPLAYNVCRHSIETRASRPVSVIPLRWEWMPVKRAGLTQFSFSRYLVPYLCDYKGAAIFLDSDMLCLSDIWELEEICRPQLASVCVVKNPLRFEWTSLMYFNNAHCSELSLTEVETGSPQSLKWASHVGDIPPEWNHLVGYDNPQAAKIVHFTQGIPCWPETKDCEYAKQWKDDFDNMRGTVSWQALMGNSVHAAPVMERLKAA